MTSAERAASAGSDPPSSAIPMLIESETASGLMSQAYTEWIVPARFMASAADPPINPIPITASFNPGSLCGGELREKLLQGGKEPFILIGRTDGDTDPLREPEARAGADDNAAVKKRLIEFSRLRSDVNENKVCLL